MHALWIALHNSRSAPHDGSMHRAASHFHHENLHLTAYCAIVEINTVCITARRVLRWQWLTIAFFATWIVLRLVWNHCLAYYLHTIMLSQQSLPGSNAWCQVVGPFAAEFGSNAFEMSSVEKKRWRRSLKRQREAISRRELQGSSSVAWNDHRMERKVPLQRSPPSLLLNVWFKRFRAKLMTRVGCHQ